MRSNKYRTCSMFAFALALSAQVPAQQKNEEEPGNTGGINTFLKESGLSFEANYILDWSRIASGDFQRRNIARGLLDLNLEIDSQDSFGFQGGTFFAEYYMLRGRNGSEEVGDIQGFSNIDGERLGHLAQLWYEQWFHNKALRIKVGKVDANQDYAFVNSATDLLNSSAGYSPTILQMPTYPYPAWSINTFFYPSDGMQVGLGLFDSSLGECPHDGSSKAKELSESRSDLFWIAEVGFNWSKSEKGKPGRLAIGPWYQSRALDRFDSQPTTHVLGLYAVFEQRLWNTSSSDEDQGLNLFLQYGHGDRSICKITHHFSLGFTHRGLLPGRQEDVAGIMWSLVSLGPPDVLSPNTYEATWELIYRLQLSRFFSLTSDLQYILDPSGGGPPNDAWVATFRLELSVGSDSF